MGYFASLARQSGLRFGSEPKAVRAVAPLDVEETILVEPPRELRPAVQDRRRVETATTEPPSVAAARTDDRAIEPSRIVSPARADAVLSATTVTPSREAVAVAGTATPNRAREQDPEALLHEPEPRVDHVEAAVVEGAPPKRLLVRDENPEDAQPAPVPFETVVVREEEQDSPPPGLFRQIQQWVAAGYQASPAGAQATDSDPTASDGPREPSVIVVERGAIAAERTRRTGAPDNPFSEPPAPVAEPRFELSIGSINVIVEGEDVSRPAPRTAVVTPDKQTRQRQASRPYSRLSRHYL